MEIQFIDSTKEKEEDERASLTLEEQPIDPQGAAQGSGLSSRSGRCSRKAALFPLALVLVAAALTFRLCPAAEELGPAARPVLDALYSVPGVTPPVRGLLTVGPPPGQRPTQPSLDCDVRRYTIGQALQCMEQFTVPGKTLQESLLAMANYYHNFYAFASIATDPPATPHSMPEEFVKLGLGVYGSENGGGAAPDEAAVDLVGGLRTLAAQVDITADVGVYAAVSSMTSLVNSLHDAHINTGKIPAAKWFDCFTLELEKGAEEGASTSMRTLLASKEPKEGDDMPTFTGVPDGKEIAAIAGVSPMKWFEGLVRMKLWPDLGYKALGARANQLFHWPLGMLHTHFIGLGNFGNINELPNDAFQVTFVDGSTEEWQWTVKRYGVLPECQDNNGWDAYVKFGQRKLRQPTDIAQFRQVMEWAQANASMEQEWGSPSAAPEPASLRTLETQEAAGPSANCDASFGTYLGNPCNGSTPLTYGFYRFESGSDGRDYAVWKLTSFGSNTFGDPKLDAGVSARTKAGFLDFWTRLVKEAKDRGVDRLLLDVSGNGGGYTFLAHLVTEFLLPELPHGEKCSMADRPLPQLYKDLAAIDNIPLLQFLGKPVRQQWAYQKLNNEPGRLKRLLKEARILLRAADDLKLLQDDASAKEFISSDRGVDSFEDYQAVLDMTKRLTLNRADAKADDRRRPLARLRARLAGSPRQVSGGYHQSVDDNPFAQAIGLDGGDPYQYPVTRAAGREIREFTAKWQNCQDSVGPDELPKQSPFKEVLILSDGRCGSSCDTATMTAYLLAKKHPEFRKIKYVTYGGLGGGEETARKTMSATSFPGGNKYSGGNTYLTDVLKAAVGKLIVAQWADLQTTVEAYSVFIKKVMKSFPEWQDEVPIFAQSELFQPALGDDPLPSEFVFVPTDFYIPKWYDQAKVTGQTAAKWSATELKDMYSEAAKFFGQ